jgi:hypothetical protein
MPSRIALLGAGFTRNWGGRLAREFVGTLCQRLVDRPWLNELLRLSGNFEQVFANRRSVAQREPDNAQAAEDVRLLNRAIREVFREMNAGLANRNFGFSTDVRCSTRRFLSRFDAIFSLNQDLLLELHYDGALLENPARWDTCGFPGVPYTHEWLTAPFKRDRVDMVLRAGSAASDLGPRVQPIYKLHGSVNWRSVDDAEILVIGTAKEEGIAGNDLLRDYWLAFCRYLFAGETEVMVIGYGFGDEHINTALLEAARHHSMKMFLVDTAGTAAFNAHRGRSRNDRNELLEIPLVGICERPLREAFEDFDNPAMQDIEGFLRGRTPAA